MSKEYIYCLKEPDSPTIWYVGRTNNIDWRFYHHLRSATDGTTLRDEWIRSLLAVGKKPIIEILEECDNGTVKAREKYWIGRMAFKNPLLKNQSGVLKNMPWHI